MLPRDNRLSQGGFKMVCYNPKPAKWHYQNKLDEKTGEIYKTKNLKFLSWSEIDIDTPWQENITMIPCGKCAGCQIDKANDWATRAILEAKEHKNNAFITLTYANDKLPKNRSLCKTDLQKFFKRFRKKGYKIRYFACGEYGPRTLRPHYHAIIYNWWPQDAKTHTKNITEDTLFTSKELEKIWGKGFCIVGRVTYETAAYVARYVYKKAFGQNKDWNTKHGRQAEFILTSRRPALAMSSITNQTKWEKIRRTDGIILKTKTGIKIKKIPQFLRNKWRELLDREEYYKYFDKRARELKTIAHARDTSDNWWQYQKKQIEIASEKYKRLDKRKDI